MADPVELMLADLAKQYAEMNPSAAFMRLYIDEGVNNCIRSLTDHLQGHYQLLLREPDIRLRSIEDWLVLDEFDHFEVFGHRTAAAHGGATEYSA